MANSLTPVEPSRPLPPPRPDCEGNLRGTATLSLSSCTTRARLPIPPLKVLPIVVVPGIMGSNLRAKRNPSKKERNKVLTPGEAAWRPPNGKSAGIIEAKTWEHRSPITRQQILDADTLEVDDSGHINSSNLNVDLRQLCADGWGEIHSDSYGQLLVELQTRLNYRLSRSWDSRETSSTWELLNRYDRRSWNTTKTGVAAELTTAELNRIAEYHYPVYACGYNWLQSNEQSASRLVARIDSIIKYWEAAKQDCKQVIIVTHSMGGLVARACAKQIPQKIAGVVHGVMPALGAPVCYRRIACGTESFSPSNGKAGNIIMGAVADIVGRNSAMTTPAMATAPGPLELLPNHLYPSPWLFARVRGPSGRTVDKVLVSPERAYEFYRDMDCWYRMIDPALADPAYKYRGVVVQRICDAIDQAERFHKEVLGTYYHENTFAFYGSDKQQLSFGTCVWTGEMRGNVSAEALSRGAASGSSIDASRRVAIDGNQILFQHSLQDVPGDGTVPHQSGAGPTGKVAATFSTSGYDHQGSYSDEAMLMLTQQLIAKIVQAAK